MMPKIKLNFFSVFAISFLGGLILFRSFSFGLACAILSVSFYRVFTVDTNNNDKLDYTNEILALLSVILTKDKKVLQSELNYVKRFLKHNFSEVEAKAYLLKFREYTQKDLSVSKICVRLNQALDSSEKRQILHLIIGAAVADRELTEGELVEVYNVGMGLRLSKVTVDSLLSMHNFYYSGQQQGGNDYQRRHQQQSRRRTSSSTTLSQAYKILEITPSATESEIKKAYRKLAIIYHPDKVMNMGEKYQENAKEKFQTIQGAYEQIKTERSIK